MTTISSPIQTWVTQFPLRRYPAEHLFWENNATPSHLYFIKNGFVQLTNTTNEKGDRIICIFKPGAFIPLSFLLSHTSLDDLQFKTVSPVVVHSIPKEDFFSHCQESSAFCMSLLTILSQALSGLILRLDYSSVTYSQQVIGILIYLAENFGLQDATTGSLEIPFPLTAGRVAAWTGATREATARVLSRLKKMHVITSHHKKTTVTNLDQLKKWEIQSSVPGIS